MSGLFGGPKLKIIGVSLEKKFVKDIRFFYLPFKFFFREIAFYILFNIYLFIIVLQKNFS